MTVIRELSLEQFRSILEHSELSRRINAIHLHHTWRPTRTEFQGRRTLEAMRRYHLEERNFSDIAQHLTIDPQGGLWTGRNWNQPPASARGHNGNSREGPFMIEVVGNFDQGRELLDGVQRQRTIAVLALLLKSFGLSVEHIRLHREFSSKSCPGTGIDHDELRREVADYLQRLARPETTARGELFATRYLEGIEVTAPLDSNWRESDEELPETDMDATQIQRLLGDTLAPVETRGGGRADSELTADVLHKLRPHVINLSLGQLSREGIFQHTSEDLGIIFAEHLPAWYQRQREQGRPCRIVIFAHGGLVDEQSGLTIAYRDLEWWYGNNVYPLFFVWETGWAEVLQQQLMGARVAPLPRGLSDISDWALENSLRGIAGILWGGMKSSALQAAVRDLGNGESGGAYLVAEKLREFVRRIAGDGGPALEIHAVGHSAGTILHAHFLEVLTRGNGPQVTTLHFLAPAIRIDLFKDKLKNLLGKKIQHLTLFTMAEDYERDDTVAFVYRKSLLYLVSRACEPVRKTPILGLEEFIRRDSELRELFGLNGNDHPAADVVWSKTAEDSGRSASRATTHGGFDEDSPTMNSVMRRILGLDDTEPLPLPHLPTRSITSVSLAPPRPVPTTPSLMSIEPSRPGGVPPIPGPAAPPRPPIRPAPAGSARRALCVGIDRYADAPLAGCVNDSKAWGQALSELGFSVDYLHDHQAIRDAILQSLGALIEGSRSGDVLVFQYAGHGTQFDDLNGDELDRFDEAFVPFDYRDGAYLLDDDLGELYNRLPSGVNLTLFMDCCHSGTNNRFAPLFHARSPGLRVRFLPHTPEREQAHRAFRTRRGYRSAATPAVGQEIHFAACQDNEYAYEQNGQGDFTRRAAGYIKEAVANGMNHHQFLETVLTRFGSNPRQHPQLLIAQERSEQRLLAPLTGTTAGVATGPELSRLATQLEELVRLLRERRAD